MEAKYTVQFFIAGYSLPNGRGVEYYDSKKAIARALQREHDNAQNCGAAYEPSEALIWKGEHEDITDIYPDSSAIIGPRGGVRFDN